MRTILWHSLNAAEQRDLLCRPAQRDAVRVTADARGIIERVRQQGDAVLLSLTQQFDGPRLERLQVTRD